MVTCDESLAESEQAANCVKKDPDERSVLLLNTGEYERAIVLLEDLLAAEQTEQISVKHVRKVRLAAAYASQANCAFLELLDAISSSPQDVDCESTVYSSDNIKDEIEKTSALNLAITYIDAIPISVVTAEEASGSDKTDEDTFYLNSARLQNSLYRPVHSTKCLKFFDFVYSSPSHHEYLTSESIAATGCQPDNLVKNLLNTAIDLLESLGCGDRISEENCASKQAELRQKALELEEKAATGSTNQQISNVMVAACKKENPEAECPPVLL